MQITFDSLAYQSEVKVEFPSNIPYDKFTYLPIGRVIFMKQHHYITITSITRSFLINSNSQLGRFFDLKLKTSKKVDIQLKLP